MLNFLESAAMAPMLHDFCKSLILEIHTTTLNSINSILTSTIEQSVSVLPKTKYIGIIFPKQLP